MERVMHLWIRMRREIERRAQTLAERLFKICMVVRTRPNGKTAADQLLDASSSAAANYRAAGRGRSPKEFKAKLGVANEEADETVFWLDYIANTGLGKGLDLMPLQKEAHELRSIIAASYATARRNQRKKDEKNGEDGGAE
jgi:four helix bundle protein